jgi:small subunit ribosomal protein S6e
MVFKINIATKQGKTFKLETEAQGLIGKELGEKISGQIVSPDLAGYEFEITGASDKSGFTAMQNVEGIGLKKLLLSYEKGMHQKPKGLKKKNAKPNGLRLRKTVRGKVISDAIVQINLKIIKDGNKKLEEIFPDQNKAPEVASTENAETPVENSEAPAEEKKE